MRDWSADVRRRLAALELAPAREAEIVDELAQHLRDFHHDLLSQGLLPDDVDRATLVELDRVANLTPDLAVVEHERIHAAAATRRYESRAWRGLRQDVVYALRLCRRRPVVMSVATAGLAAAIGLTTVVFGVINALALRPAGVTDPERVVRLDKRSASGEYAPWTIAEHHQLRGRATRFITEPWRFVGFGGSSGLPAGDHERIPVHLVGDTFFDTFGGSAVRGRLLTPTDHRPGAPTVAVVSYAFWVHRLDAAADIVGRTLDFGGINVRVVGVAASGFSGPTANWDAPAAFWMPLDTPGLASGAGQQVQPVSMLAKIHEDETMAAAEAEATALVAGMASGSVPVVRFRLVDPPLDADHVLTIVLFLSIVGLVLLLAYANIANLLLASASVRRAEFGARLALGATRGRLLRQMLTESALLGISAAAIGLLLAQWTGPTLAHLAWIPSTFDLAPDWRVYMFVLVVTAAAVLICGLAAGRQALTGDTAAALRTGPGSGGAGTRLRHTLIGAQSAACVIFLIGAALFARSLLRTTHGDHGFDPDVLLAVTVNDRELDDARARNFRMAALQRLRSLPGVAAAALTQGIPYVSGFTQIGDGRAPRTFAQNRADGAYFSALGAQLRRGRFFGHDEARRNAPVALISETLARTYFPDQDPLGARLDRVHPSLASTDVIGIVADVRIGVRRAAPPLVYLPLADVRDAHLVVRATTDASSLVTPVQDALRALDADVAVRVRPIREAIDRGVGPVRMLATVTGMLAAFTTSLAIIGLAGVTAFTVQQRRREIGIRLTLGAPGRRIVALLLGQSLRPVGIGLGVGVLIALAAGDLVSSVLYGIGPREPTAIAGAVLLLAGTAAGVVVFLSRQAARLDPARVLREN